MTVNKGFQPKFLVLVASIALASYSMVGHAAEATKKSAAEEWKFTLKNAYINRDFDQAGRKDAGSWSQSASWFYNSKMQDTPLHIASHPITIGADASLQYAVRLSSDKHVSDFVLPFDKESRSQAPDQLKYGATLKLGYLKNQLNIGELWPSLPVTHVDTSRQLLTSYWGTQLKSKLMDQLDLELGRIEKVNPRNEEDFRKFSFTSNGVTTVSDGLNFIDLRYQLTPTFKAEYYFGNMEDLYDTHYLGLDHNWKLSDFTLNSRLRYFNAKDDSHAFKVDAQNIGVLETVKYKNHSLGLGYQDISGDTAYPLLDGFLPELFFINWNTTGFIKKDEKSYHAIYSFDFKDYVPGLTTTLKYAYGKDFKTVSGLDNRESEANLILGYALQDPRVKGLSFQYVHIDYDVKHGVDFKEDRIFVNYVKKF